MENFHKKLNKSLGKVSKKMDALISKINQQHIKVYDSALALMSEIEELALDQVSVPVVKEKKVKKKKKSKKA